MNILSIDIGGTKTATAVCTVDNGLVTSVQHEIAWPSRDHGSLDEILMKWRDLHKSLPIQGVGIGVPGPVTGGFLKQFGRATNLGWDLDSVALRRSFANTPVYLCNDMESHGWGILGLQSSDIAILNQGQSSPGCKALIAAGTGLGESIIAWSGKQHIPIGGEGGHAAFSPSNDKEDRLLIWLRKRLNGHVSWERILGGRYGFRYLAEFSAEDSRQDLPQNLKTAVKDKDDWGAAVIDLATNDSFCSELLSWYAALYGREAANLALKCVAHSGVYIGGGIAPRILPWLEKHFMTGFTDKGRFSQMLSEMPVYVITDKMNGLKGAALGASQMIQ